jgi:hypothetical protein
MSYCIQFKTHVKQNIGPLATSVVNLVKKLSIRLINNIFNELYFNEIMYKQILNFNLFYFFLDT